MPKKIKLFWQLGAVLALLMVVGIAAAVVLPRMGVSDLYRHYQDNPHLAVTYLRNFPVNDTLAVDVTILTALDDEGWDTLLVNYNILPLPQNMQEKINNGQDIVTVFFAPKTNPTLPMDTTDLLKNNVLGISRLHHTVSIFITETEGQQDAVLHYNYRVGFKN